MSWWISFALVLATALRGGLCIVTSSTPDNNTEIVHFSGTENVTFECIVQNPNRDDEIAVSNWNIENFRGTEQAQTVRIPLPDTILLGNSTENSIFFPTFRTTLIFPEFLADFHLATLTCGFSPTDPLTVRYPLRVYGAPNLTQNALIRFQENARGVQVNVERGRAAFPLPMFEWMRDGEPVSNTTGRVYFGYPLLTIATADRADSGAYTLTATNYILEEPFDQLGNDTGSFTLDILYGPEIDLGPTERAVRLGDPLDLECGTGLMSNPQATVTWRDPRNEVVLDNARYTLVNNETGVRLLFATTILSDMGIWRCEVRVDGVDVTTEGGDVTDILIGTNSLDINLSIVVAPGQPGNLSVDDIGATWVSLCWQAPNVVVGSGIARYDVTITNTEDNSTFISSTMDETTNMNVTGLLPNIQYEFRVQAVAMLLEVANPGVLSTAAMGTTLVTVPAPQCNTAMSIGGSIRIAWDFLHTGGQTLIDVSITYVFKEGNLNISNPGPVVGTEVRTVDIPSLVAGVRYIPRVNATNENGFMVVDCPLVNQDVGIPRDPENPVVEDLGGGSIRVTVRTLASGLEPSGGEFSFILTLAPETDIGMMVERTMPENNYRSGDNVMFNIDDVSEGIYTISVRAMNSFGTSGTVDTVYIGEASTTTTPSSDTSNAGAIAGGIIGALIAILLIVVIIVVLVFIYLKFIRGPGNSYKPASSEPKDEPALTKVEVINDKEATPDIGRDLSKKELHYADLESFRSPTATSPSEVILPPNVEPVEYATIDTFKKAPEEKPPSPGAKTGTSTSVV